MRKKETGFDIIRNQTLTGNQLGTTCIPVHSQKQTNKSFCLKSQTKNNKFQRKSNHLEAVAHNVAWCMRVVGSQYPCELLFQLSLC